MDTTSMLGSRLAQLGALAEIDQVARAQGCAAARRHAAATLVARAAVRRSRTR